MDDSGSADTVAASSLDPEANTVAAHSSGPGPVRLADRASLGGGFERYQAREVLGVGGMGEVARCTDARIGRDVALKVMREGLGDTLSAARRRFEREARIQGQLEHPSIVPIYDLGVRPDGVAYFTMKRVRGRTLQAIVDGLRDEDPDICAEYSRHRLLGVFEATCQAIAYANDRGVVHRDLKPDNIIVGNFGEVYVLDWGVAKVMGEAEELFFDGSPVDQQAATLVGAVLGTPGYMAPEQARGALEVDARADVYALGLILFELLTLRRFHHGATVEAVLTHTLESGPASPLAHAPDGNIAPELDELCVRATAPDTADRLASAVEVRDLLEAYLAGHRDAKQRAELARARVESADAALAIGHEDPEREVASRAEAIRELLAAFALDPDNAEAKRAMVRALTETGDRLPHAALDELEELRSEQRRRAARNATAGLVATFGVAPLLAWNGLRAMWPLATMIAMLALCVGVGSALARARRITPTHYLGLMGALAVFNVSTATLFGPLVLSPMLALAFAAALIAGSRMPMAWRATMIIIAVVSVLLPTAAALGLDAWPYEVVGGVLHVSSIALELSTPRTMWLLLLTQLFGIVVPTMLVGRSVAVLHQAEEQQFAHAWRLRRIFPTEVDDATKERTVRPPAP